MPVKQALRHFRFTAPLVGSSLHAAGIIASKRCNNVKIFNNEVYDGGEDAAGIFLHRSSDDAKVYSEL